MPLGDPQGGDFEYTDEGLPENITAVRVPTKNLSAGMKFYINLLGMDVVTEKESYAVLRREIGRAHV